MDMWKLASIPWMTSFGYMTPFTQGHHRTAPCTSWEHVLKLVYHFQCESNSDSTTGFNTACRTPYFQVIDHVRWELGRSSCIPAEWYGHGMILLVIDSMWFGHRLSRAGWSCFKFLPTLPPFSPTRPSPFGLFSTTTTLFWCMLKNYPRTLQPCQLYHEARRFLLCRGRSHHAPASLFLRS